MADVPLYQQPAANPVQPTGPEPVAPTAAPGVTGATGIPGIPGALAAAPPQVPNIDLSGGMPQSAPSPQMPQAPQQPNQDQQPGIPAPFDNNPSTRGGPVKNALTRMLYGMGQAGLQHVGLPTDYDIQKTQFDQAMKARQVQVDQMHEQLLQRTQDYNQTLITTRDPYTGQVVQVAPRDLGKVLTAGITAQGRADVAGIQSQFKSTQQGLWNTRPSGGGEPKLIPNSGPAGTVLTPEMAQEMGIPTNSPMVGQWMNVSQLNTLGAAYMRPATISGTSQQVVPTEGGGYDIVTKGSSSRKVPLGASSTTAPPAVQGPPGMPPAVSGVVPPNTPASKAMNRNRGGGGGAGTARPLLDAQGNPVKGPNATKWKTWTDTDGRMVAAPASEVAQRGVQNAGDMPGSDVTAMMNARQAYQNYTKVGDPKQPATWGVIQLIKSLEKDGQLGVATSRLNNFMTKHVGAEPGDDPRIIALLDKNHLGATKTMLAHIGKARSKEAVDMFLDMANAGTMNGPTLLHGTEAMADYMKDAGMIPSAGGAAAPSGDLSIGTIANHQDGSQWKYKGGGSADAKNWDQIAPPKSK